MNAVNDMPTSMMLIKQLGDTNKQYLSNNTPQLALTRTNIRLILAKMSKHGAERCYFIQEAIVIAEQARLTFDEMPLKLYINLSVALAAAYLAYHDASDDDASKNGSSKNKRYALIAEQILRPLAHHNCPDVFAKLQQACHYQNKSALARHWQHKATSSVTQTEHSIQA